MTGRRVGIAATACAFPSATSPIDAVCAAEGVELTEGTRARLGIDEVHVGQGTEGWDLGVTAASRALERAGVEAKALDVIIDFTILPEQYLVPVWNLGSKVQHELGATNAFVLGFSGGGASNFHVALRVGADLLRGNPSMRAALLFGAEVAIPGNRVINQDDPHTVLGDGASSLVLVADSERNEVLGCALATDGALHDICYIPGGALAQLGDNDASDLYRMRLDAARLDAATATSTLTELTQRVLAGAGVGASGVGTWLCPNLSAADQALYAAAWGTEPASVCAANLAARGHVQGTDLVANIDAALAGGGPDDGELVLVGSHGLGFTAGVALLRC